MLEFGQILALLSVVVLFVAGGLWSRLAWSRAPHPTHGRFAADFAPPESVSRLIAVALALSTLAAILAVAGWIGL